MFSMRDKMFLHLARIFVSNKQSLFGTKCSSFRYYAVNFRHLANITLFWPASLEKLGGDGGRSADEERNEQAWRRVKGLTSAVMGDIKDKDGKRQDPVFLLKQARLFLHHVDSSDLLSKDDILSEVFSDLGQLYMQLQQPAKGLLNHQKDLKLSRKTRNKETEVRALLNIADCYDVMGEPKEAAYYRNQAGVVTGVRDDHRQAMQQSLGMEDVKAPANVNAPIQ